jgi:exodeoxyribonuclease VII large subunit
MSNVNSLKEYSVTEITKAIKDSFEKCFFFVKIRGEVTGFKRHVTSGHCYFSLKDKDSTINLIIFKNNVTHCSIIPTDGMEVIATGKITNYKERSNYYLNVDTITVSGEGVLLKILQDRKEKLKKEGLFESKRKRIIKNMPGRVAIITAENSAALQDILIRLKNRTPIYKLYLYNSIMQGITASDNIIKGIKYINSINETLKLDALVITRGGGSMEDLMAFNSEELAREVVKSKIPVISAIGHEIDWTIIDYVSDLRLPTPTSVAEHLTITNNQALININSLFKKFLFAKINKYRKRKNKIFKKEFRYKKIYAKKVAILKKKILKIYNIFLFFLRKKRISYYTKKNRLIKINPNLAVKIKLIKCNQKIQSITIRIMKYEKKYPIIRDSKNFIIKFKKEILMDNVYTIEFPDGNIKFMMVEDLKD